VSFMEAVLCSFMPVAMSVKLSYYAVDGDIVTHTCALAQVVTPRVPKDPRGPTHTQPTSTHARRGVRGRPPPGGSPGR
jgi:hypothetical protein